MMSVFKQFTFLIIAVFVLNLQAVNLGLIKDQVILSDGKSRTYDLYVPNKKLRHSSPLVLLLHGHGGNADMMTGQNKKAAPYKVWLDIAEREGLILVIPDGVIGTDKFRGWNDCKANATTNPDTDDVNFLNSLIDTVSDKYPIDKNRIYAHGTSNGGLMVFRLAQESTAKFRAIAAVVAAMPDKSECVETKEPISVLVMNGTKDPLMPYEGGSIGGRNAKKIQRGSVMSTSDTIKYWVDNNGINSEPRVKRLPNINRRDRSTVRTQQYINKSNNTEVVHYKINGGGHTEPSLTEHYRGLFKLIVGKQNKDFEMAEEVWKFFERNP